MTYRAWWGAVPAKGGPDSAPPAEDAVSLSAKLDPMTFSIAVSVSPAAEPPAAAPVARLIVTAADDPE